MQPWSGASRRIRPSLRSNGLTSSTTIEVDRLKAGAEEHQSVSSGRLAVVGPTALSAEGLTLPVHPAGPARHKSTPARARWIRSIPFMSFLLLVVTPTVIGAIYLLVFATNQYTSEFRVTVRSVQPLAQASGLVSMLGLAGMSQASTDSHAVVQYLQSRQAIEDLDATVPLRKLFAAPDIDWLSRLSPTSTIEGLSRYWDKMLDIYYESTTSTIVVKGHRLHPGERTRHRQGRAHAVGATGQRPVGTLARRYGGHGRGIGDIG